ncbi:MULTISPECIES: hypothetical protein [Acidiphilium]|uniref:Uncharacterized protein n=1 Tax=Acidiphilium rubrum TaxID=526 RepID=A0A8G2CLS9_ACIRU|nr:MULTISPECIES: hypothetical protein [Acidiphilium]SIQ81961.1 hypothetical protein SAMN05421828_11019 [Acidiphilium rubrum]
MTQFRPISDYRIDWGPYASQAEAAICLGQFADATLGFDVGIIYCDSAAACLLRRAVYGADDNGYALIVQSHGPVRPPRLREAPPGFLARVERFFEEACAAYGRQQIAQGQMDIAMGQAMERWLSNPTHEHEIGIAVDVLGIVSFAMLFVPGIGEAEIGLVGSFRAAMAAEKYWQAAGLVTAGMGFAGSISGGVSDSVYLFKRFDDGPDGSEKADRWDDGLTGQVLATASVILSLPDLAVGSVLLAKELPEIAQDAAKANQEAVAFADRSKALASRAGRLDSAALSSGNADLGSRVGVVTSYARARAKFLTEQSIALNAEAVQLNRKLYTTMMVNGSATLLGSPMMDAYFAHDARQAYARGKPGPEGWIGQYLDPPVSHGIRTYRPPKNLSLHIGATRRPRKK